MVTQFRSTETIKKVSLTRDEKDRQSGPVFVSTAGAAVGINPHKKK